MINRAVANADDVRGFGEPLNPGLPPGPTNPLKTYLGLQNPDNLGQGDNVCREFFKRGRETRLPENLASIAGAEPPDQQASST